MRIKQIYSRFGWHLMPELMEKYSLVRVTKDNEPCLFFGIYGDSQIETALNWRAPIVIWLSGSDVLHLKTKPQYIEAFKNKQDVRFIATVNFIEQDLKEMGIPYLKVPLFSHKIDKFKPYPLGDSIYVYKPNSVVYCPPVIYKRIREEFKGVNFIEAQNHHTFTQKEMVDVYKKTRLGIRLVKHDGLSHSAAELGLSGKKIIWNGDTPNAVSWESGVIEAIHKGLEDYNPFELYDKMIEYLDTDDKWLEV